MRRGIGDTEDDSSYNGFTLVTFCGEGCLRCDYFNTSILTDLSANLLR
jgi:hypothetical protein